MPGINASDWLAIRAGDVGDETIDKWLDQEIQYAENAVGMNRSYRQPYEVENARLQALKDVRAKMKELWGHD